MNTAPSKPPKPKARLLPPYLMMMVGIPPIFIIIFSPTGSEMMIAAVTAAVLLVGLLFVMVSAPSTAKEFDKRLDTEASTVTLGMTMYAALFYPVFEMAFELPEFHPLMVVGFIFVVYLISRGILRLKYR